jgi:hypothetical protein
MRFPGAGKGMRKIEGRKPKSRTQPSNHISFNFGKSRRSTNPTGSLFRINHDQIIDIAFVKIASASAARHLHEQRRTQVMTLTSGRENVLVPAGGASRHQ